MRSVIFSNTFEIISTIKQTNGFIKIKFINKLIASNFSLSISYFVFQLNLCKLYKVFIIVVKSLFLTVLHQFHKSNINNNNKDAFEI